MRNNSDATMFLGAAKLLHQYVSFCSRESAAKAAISYISGASNHEVSYTKVSPRQGNFFWKSKRVQELGVF